MWSGDCCAMADGLGAIFVGRCGGVVCAVDLMCTVSFWFRALSGLLVVVVIWIWYHRTLSMASLTRSDLMRLFLARLLIRLSLVVPELRQAILNGLLASLV